MVSNSDYDGWMDEFYNIIRNEYIICLGSMDYYHTTNFPLVRIKKVTFDSCRITTIMLTPSSAFLTNLIPLHFIPVVAMILLLEKAKLSQITPP